MKQASEDIDTNNSSSGNIAKKVKDILSKQLGTDPEDIGDDDSFSDHLNMRPSDISDFFNRLEENSIDTKNIDIEVIKTVGDIIEYLSVEESL
jgi:acyl carrier protein